MDSWGENRDLVYILTCGWAILAFMWAWNEHEVKLWKQNRKDWLERNRLKRRASRQKGKA